MTHHLFTAKRNAAKYIFHGILQIRIRLSSAQLPEIAGHSAHIFGNRHMVIIEYDDEICLHLCRIVECFVCHAPGQGSVSDHGDYRIILSKDIPSPGISKAG